MPSRRQSARQTDAAASTSNAFNVESLAKRTRRHLDDLERSNYAENVGAFDDDLEATAGGRKSRGAARQTISDKRDWGNKGKKKKSSMNIRTALLYRKNLATLIDESRIAALPPEIPTYLTAVAPAPTLPPRIFCSVCGYWGRYKCMKCAMPYCDLNCRAIHVDTRCDKRVI